MKVDRKIGLILTLLNCNQFLWLKTDRFRNCTHAVISIHTCRTEYSATDRRLKKQICHKNRNQSREKRTKITFDIGKWERFSLQTSIGLAVCILYVSRLISVIKSRGSQIYIIRTLFTSTFCVLHHLLSGLLQWMQNVWFFFVLFVRCAQILFHGDDNTFFVAFPTLFQCGASNCMCATYSNTYIEYLSYNSNSDCGEKKSTSTCNVSRA